MSTGKHFKQYEKEKNLGSGNVLNHMSFTFVA